MNFIEKGRINRYTKAYALPIENRQMEKLKIEKDRCFYV